MSKMPKAGAVERVKAAILGKSGRSPLYRWLKTNYDEFASALDEAGRPNWTAIAEAIAAEGILDGDGKAPNAERARQTWYMVRKDIEAVRAKRKKATEPPASPSLPPSVRLAPQQAPEAKPSPSGSDDVRRRGMEAQRWLHPSLNKKDRE